MLRQRSPLHFRQCHHVLQVRGILERLRAGINQLFDDIPAEGCDCRFNANSRIIAPMLSSVEEDITRLRKALQNAGLTQDN